MSKSSDYGGLNIHILSDRSLYRLIEQHDDGLHELPDDREFVRPETVLRRKRISRIRQRLSGMIPRRRRYAFQPA